MGQFDSVKKVEVEVDARLLETKFDLVKKNENGMNAGDLVRDMVFEVQTATI